MACTEIFYIQSAASLKEKVNRYDRIIEALGIHMETVALQNSDITGYSLDDGQVKISTQYRDPVSIALAIDKFEAQKQKALNSLNGRSFVLRGWRGLS